MPEWIGSGGRPACRRAGHPARRVGRVEGAEIWIARSGKGASGTFNPSQDHAPEREDSSGRPSSRPSPVGRRRTFAADSGGLSHAQAGTSRVGSHGRGRGLLQRGKRDALSLRERVGVREPVSTLAFAFMERWMTGPVGAGAILSGLEPGIPGGETPPSTAGGTPAATAAWNPRRRRDLQPLRASSAVASARRSWARMARQPTTIQKTA
jgi:hypothetical protein